MDRSIRRRLKVFQLITRDQSPSEVPFTFPETYSEFNSCSHLSISSNSSLTTEGFKSMDFSFLDIHDPGITVTPSQDFSQSSFSSQLYSNIYSSLDSEKNSFLPLSQGFPDMLEEFKERGRPKKRPLHDIEKNYYIIHLDLIKEGKDQRTTVMIKNIPNKYTQKMLLAAINKNFSGVYNFIYLPIDFKNKCNVGYAFINFVDPSVICDFYQEFNGKKWEKFNSVKICALAYARIQGISELLTHFQNSSVINQEDNKIKPVILANYS